jgi:hypothetical protein
MTKISCGKYAPAGDLKIETLMTHIIMMLQGKYVNGSVLW